MYAIIETSGQQIKVEVGQKIFIEKISAKVNEKYTFDKVLCVVGEKIIFGQPYVKDAKVIGKVEKHGLSKKLHIFKYKAKHNERKRIGHRQRYTSVIIEDISLNSDVNDTNIKNENIESKIKVKTNHLKKEKK